MTSIVLIVEDDEILRSLTGEAISLLDLGVMDCAGTLLRRLCLRRHAARKHRSVRQDWALDFLCRELACRRCANLLRREDYRDATGANLVFTPSGAVARIIGLTLTLPDGQQYDLIETERTVEGVTHEPIEDPDLYRALVDAAQVAQKCRDLRTFERVRALIDLAKFHTCPTCLDRFDRCEDCEACLDRGFFNEAGATGLP